MKLKYTCVGTTNTKSEHWEGEIEILKQTSPYEINVSARNSSFHIICGKHQYGNYICIPNWNIGAELAALSDRFWNFEQLARSFPELSKVDALSISYALVKLNEYISLTEEAG
ncbi:hypothetical protein LJC51_03085 [Lachnospiraceae bacterium OttesenSCG-928-J05]|nr:hypothetical protein [Lachnospiraceae bacterium OttesenSCG-928-J05]